MALAVEFELGICSERCLPKNVGFLFAEAEVLPRLGSARVRWSIYVVSTVESELGIRFERSDVPPAKNTEMTELPSDLFMEILSLIPAPTLFKLRCVCKCWYSITTDPIFVRLHLQQQQLLPEVTSVLTVHRDFTNDRSLLSRLDVVDASWVAKHVAIWHSPPLLVVSPPCHGLFCLYHTYMEFDVCLYNPATHKIFSLPQNFTNVMGPIMEDTSPSDEKVDQRSGQSCRVTRPRKRPCTHGRPHQGDSSSYVAGRPQHLALEEGPMSQDRLPNLFPSRVTDEAVLPTPTVVTMP
ncbi:hypothetical protein BHM03_00020621 [Ensete ventricosum]|nr:hypothetical protein BHM03_00020621 [Ensete ventricosum]